MSEGGKKTKDLYIYTTKNQVFIDFLFFIIINSGKKRKTDRTKQKKKQKE